MAAQPPGLARFDNLADLLAHELDCRGWSAGALAREWVKRGLSDPPHRSSVCQWRKGAQIPSPGRLVALSHVFGWDDWTFAHVCRLAAQRDAA